MKKTVELFWVCDCGWGNGLATDDCDQCGMSRPGDPLGTENWRCFCGAFNTAAEKECRACGRHCGGDNLPEQEIEGPMSVQVGGGHYKDFAIQPVEFIHKNGIGYIEGNCIKYLCRWRDKGGKQDLEKVKHYIDLLLSME